MARKSILEMDAAKVFDLQVEKAEKKGRTAEEVEKILIWLTGYTHEQIQAQINRGIDWKTLFQEAPQRNPRSELVSGFIYGLRIEEITDPVLHDARVMDKMVDELTRGRTLDRILRTDEPGTVDEYIAAQDPKVRPHLIAVREAVRKGIPEAKEIISWGMPTYRGKRNVVHFAATKQYVSLSAGFMASIQFAEELKEYRVIKGTIQLPYEKPVPGELIEKVVAWSWNNMMET